MDLLIELDDLRVDSLELGLQKAVAGSLREAVRAATRLGRVVGVVLELGNALATPAKLVST